MRSSLILLSLSVIAILLSLVLVSSPRQTAYAFNPFQCVCNPNSSTDSTSPCSNTATNTSTNTSSNPVCATQAGNDPITGAAQEGVLLKVTDLISFIAGAAAVIIIIIAGLQYIISAGDSAKISAAKNVIIYAVIGLVVILLAQVIVRFAVSSVKL